MNALIKTLGIFAVIPLLVSACGGHTVHAQSAEENNGPTTSYQVVLDKSLTDKDVADFIANNNCLPAAEFQLCKDTGMALWTDSDLVVKTVYLYSGNTNGFRRYRGQLPYGLSFYDPMWRVEEKLRDLNANDTLQQLGLPDEGVSPDHMYYRAVYRRFGMTVIYNSPGKDEDAYIYAIVVSQ